MAYTEERKANYKRITVEMKNDLYQRLLIESKRKEVSMSEIIRRSLFKNLY